MHETYSHVDFKSVLSPIIALGALCFLGNEEWAIFILYLSILTSQDITSLHHSSHLLPVTSSPDLRSIICLVSLVTDALYTGFI